MSKYTTELRFVCATYTRPIVEGWFKDYELSDYLTPTQIETIENAGIWSKGKLAKKIVDHYYMREIGLETPALFEHETAAITAAKAHKILFISVISFFVDANLIKNDFTLLATLWNR